MKNERIHIRITEQLKTALKERADRDGKTVSEWIIDLIKFELKKEA